MGAGLPGHGRLEHVFSLLLGFMVINSLGILKGHSWVAAGPVFAQTGMMSAYSLWSSAILRRIPGAYGASLSCWPAR